MILRKIAFRHMCQVLQHHKKSFIAPLALFVSESEREREREKREILWRRRKRRGDRNIYGERKNNGVETTRTSWSSDPKH